MTETNSKRRPPFGIAHILFWTTVSHMSESPYRSPDTLHPVSGRGMEGAPRASNTAPLLLGSAVVGALLGFGGYSAAALWLEPRRDSTEVILSHGQQAALLSAPLCMALGSAMAVGLALAWKRYDATSVMVLWGASVLGLSINHHRWTEQLQSYGPDPSELVLYYPPLVYATTAAVLGLGVAIGAVAIRLVKAKAPRNLLD